MRSVCVALALGGALFHAACGPSAVDPRDIGTTKVSFPNGKFVRVERMTGQRDMALGMKYRDTLAEDRGMLFIFAQEVKTGFWTYEVKVPLDMLWLSQDRVIVKIEPNVPPCPGPPQACRSYGNDQAAMYILELAAGVAAKNNLRPGMRLDF